MLRQDSASRVQASCRRKRLGVREVQVRIMQCDRRPTNHHSVSPFISPTQPETAIQEVKKLKRTPQSATKRHEKRKQASDKKLKAKAKPKIALTHAAPNAPYTNPYPIPQLQPHPSHPPHKSHPSTQSYSSTPAASSPKSQHRRANPVPRTRPGRAGPDPSSASSARGGSCVPRNR